MASRCGWVTLVEATVISCNDDNVDDDDVGADVGGHSDEGGRQVNDLVRGHSQALKSQCHTCTIVPNP